MLPRERLRRLPAPRLPWLLLAALLLPGCIGNRMYNRTPEEYLQEVTIDDGDASFDLAIIEFDDQGQFWNTDQLRDTMGLIERRNAASETGVAVILYVHGWRHNADPSRSRGDLLHFRDQLAGSVRSARERGDAGADRVIGIYLGWRGDISRLPLLGELSFWDRRRAAERVASIDLVETLFQIVASTKQRSESKCFFYGHSMGAAILGRAYTSTLTNLLLQNRDRGTRRAIDLLLLANPARDALSTWQFIEFLKRHRARVELEREDGTRVPAAGPMVVSITSEDDRATGVLYPIGLSLEHFGQSFRGPVAEGAPTQWHLATHAEGHVDYLVSHRARVEEDEVILEDVPDRYNDTPYWVIQVSPEISRDHGDIHNPRFRELLNQIIDLNHVLDTDVEMVLTIDPLVAPEP